MNLVSHVERSIVSRGLLRDGQSVLVAVSGGVDSMVLLDVLHRLAPKHGWKLTVAHFNHRLRGRASDADERFVRDRAAKLGLRFVRSDSEVRALQRAVKWSLEMAARMYRRKFLHRTARGLGCNAIALAHHADDQAELFFIRLFRGAGGRGFGGMEWSSHDSERPPIQRVRPLLDLPKSALLAHARKHKIRFREDASNLCRDILRNRIRHELLPLLAKKYQPSIVDVVQRSMAILDAEAKFAEAAAHRWLDSKRRRPFASLHVAVQRQALRLQLELSLVPVGFQLVESLRQSPGAIRTAERGVRVWRDERGTVSCQHGKPGSLTFKFSGSAVDLRRSQGGMGFAGVNLVWKRRPRQDSDAKLWPEKFVERFDADAVRGFVRLRHWQPGDRFQPIGMPKPVKLQDLFTNAKIAAAKRRELVVAADFLGNIFWVEGLRIGEHVKVTPETKCVLEWRWERIPAKGSGVSTARPAP